MVRFTSDTFVSDSDTFVSEHIGVRTKLSLFTKYAKVRYD